MQGPITDSRLTCFRHPSSHDELADPTSYIDSQVLGAAGHKAQTLSRPTRQPSVKLQGQDPTSQPCMCRDS